MRIAVSGASGFIGRHAVTALVAQGHQVLAVGRSAPPEAHGVTFVEANLLADGGHAWIAQHRPSHLLHLAWYAEHGKFWDSPLNVDWCRATVRLIAAFCEHGGEGVVAAGSCAEYDWTFGYCREGITPCNPASVYGIAKDSARRLAEKVCAERGVPLAWGRIFLPFGPGESSQRLIPSVVEALLGRQPPFAINAGHWRDLMPVADVAEAFAWLSGQQAAGTFNICSGVPTQIGAIVRQLAADLGCDPEPLLKMANKPAVPPVFLAGDNSALLKTGWTPRYKLDESLRAYSKILSATR